MGIVELLSQIKTGTPQFEEHNFSLKNSVGGVSLSHRFVPSGTSHAYIQADWPTYSPLHQGLRDVTWPSYTNLRCIVKYSLPVSEWNDQYGLRQNSELSIMENGELP